jgi:sec-independent protein translocase protein TatB
VFDISFSELVVVAVVALLVIGPEKLPKLARTLGAYAGRMQRFVAQVKDEVNREVRFEELQKLQQEVKSATLQAESSIMASVSAIHQTANTELPEPVNNPTRSRKKVSTTKAADTAIGHHEALPASSKASAKSKRPSAAKTASATDTVKPKPARVSKKIAD